MKKLLLIATLLSCMVSITGCDKGGENEPANIEIAEGSSSISLPQQGTQYGAVSFTTRDTWRLITSDASGSGTTRAIPTWFDVYPKSGNAGTYTLTLSIKENNMNSDDRTGYIIITCGDEVKEIPVTQKGGEIFDISKSSYAASGDGMTLGIEVKSNIGFTVEVPSYADWITELPASRAALTTSMKQFKIAPNPSDEGRRATIVFKTADSNEEILISQSPKGVKITPESTYKVNEPGGTIEMEVPYGVDLDVDINADAMSWVTYEPVGEKGSALRFNIAKNTANGLRKATVILTSGTLSQVVTIQQSIYFSTDYSADGRVSVLQSASEGNGIDIVMMGDAFSDRLIADGTYEKIMRRAVDHFFSEEPHKSFKNLYNIYMVEAVSENEGYGSGSRTVFEGYFGTGTEVGGDHNTVQSYARRAISDSRMDDALIIVMMNSTNYAGTCYMWRVNAGDYGRGNSIAYFPLIDGDDEEFRKVLVHECGHGFSKLADEYSYSGSIPSSEVSRNNSLAVFGWNKNVDFTGNPTQVKWSKFLADSRYAPENLGVFEGACTYAYGAYRPREESMMRHNTGGFNAPSREAIYYRIHKLAYGDGWQYNYEEFVEWDAKNVSAAASTARTAAPMTEKYRPFAPPVIMEYSWREEK